MDINVLLPAGALGRVDDEDRVTSMLRDIGVAIEKADPKQAGQWAEKYGAYYDCDEFMMHPYCWCERESCPWCRGCDCPSSAYHYLVRGKEVDYATWVEAYDERDDSCRTSRHDPICEFCVKYGGKSEPNFWHKPTGLKVWWYKYIGRGMEVEVGAAADVAPILAACLARVRV